MTLVETRERIRKARSALEPLVSGDKTLGRKINDILNQLAEVEAEKTYENAKRKV